MTTISPQGLERLARKRYAARTGRQWRYASLEQRRAWWRYIEPILRGEHNIAPDAVYRDGEWQTPDQLDLFTTASHASTEAGGQQ